MMVYLYADSFLANIIIMICLISALQSKCKSRAELAKLAWAIMPKYRANESRAKLVWAMPSAADIQRS